MNQPIEKAEYLLQQAADSLDIIPAEQLESMPTIDGNGFWACKIEASHKRWYYLISTDYPDWVVVETPGGDVLLEYRNDPATGRQITITDERKGKIAS